MARSAAPQGSTQPADDGTGWRGSITLGGQRHQRRGQSAAEVERKLAGLRIVTQLDADQAAADALAELAWQAALDSYLATSSPTPATAASYRKIARAHIEHAPFWSRPVAAATPAEIEAYVATLSRRDGHQASRATREAVLSLLRRVGEHAANVAHFGVKRSPVAGIRLPAPPAAAPTPQLTPEQVDQLLEAAGAISTRARVRWGLALELGLRSSEALALTASDIEQATKTLRLRIAGTLVRLPASPHHPAAWVRRELAQPRTFPIPRSSNLGHAIAQHLGDLADRRAATTLPPRLLVERADLLVGIGRGAAERGEAATYSLPSDWLLPRQRRLDLPTTEDSDRRAWHRLLTAVDLPAMPRRAARRAAGARLHRLGCDPLGVAAVLGEAGARAMARHPDELTQRSAAVLRLALRTTETR
ncbi:hypothetical protein C5B85_10800 [Pseudoclavibacter sp. AY1F1]|uniref:tyrosine-type recombinase/integrase n=1 Tax=Pseudoclavibacter sp. AY1F1 TaxID=2080583 RepID=UPI000CE8A69E|nr:tyrosine-type recombinase/integrase [Pseudoclavibacter sp. AY1F1]PPF44126.1 hypothetical protein C5B85_10800 [Pseudoclavibacter sp. AY1F1]